ncbi:MAG: hypothetical protein ACLGG4_08240 [Gammaproteobacteria bacterium]
MDFPNLPRRRFLTACVAAGGVATVLAIPACARAPGTDAVQHATRLGPLLVLDDDQVAILEAFAEAAIATGDGFPDVREADVVRRIDEELFFTDEAIREDFLLGLSVADYLPLAYGHFSRLHRMSLASRRAFLDGLTDTRIDIVRALVNGLRMTTGLMYYAHRSTWAAMGFEGTHAGLPPRDDEQRAYYRSRVGDGAASPSPGAARHPLPQGEREYMDLSPRPVGEREYTDLSPLPPGERGRGEGLA